MTRPLRKTFSAILIQVISACLLMPRTIQVDPKCSPDCCACSTAADKLTNQSAILGDKFWNGDTNGDESVLNIIGMFPMTGGWSAGNGSSLAALMALEHVSQRSDILPGYKLNFTILNTRCSPGYAVSQLFNQVIRKHFILIFGAGCSVVSMPMAETMVHWNIPQLSWGSTSPSLSDKTRYPLFLRVTDSDADANPLKLAFMDEFNWSKAAIIHHSAEFFASITKDLVEQMKRQNKTLLTSEIFHDDPKTQVENLKRHDARIIFLHAYETEAVKVFCEAYKQGMYGGKYVWVIVAWYTEGWREKHIGGTRCTVEDLDTFMDGSVFEVAGVLDNTDVEERGFAGISNEEYWELFKKKKLELGLGEDILSGEDYGPSSYDGIWVAALALNATLTQAIQEKSADLRPENFDYSNKNFTRRFYANMRLQSFVAVSKGFFTFNKKGDIVATQLLHQDQRRNGKLQKKVVGLYKPNEKPGKQLVLQNGSAIRWLGGQVPRDSVIKKTRFIAVSAITYTVMISFAGVGILLALVFICFNFALRNVRVIKMSSPNLNNAILAGCICTYVSTYFASFEQDKAVKVLSNCRFKKYFLLFGFTLAFGGLFSKTFRVYRIFSNVKMNKKAIKDFQLFGMILGLLLVNALVCAVSEVLGPIKNVRELVKTESQGDYIINVYYEKCQAKYDHIFMGILLGVQGVLLVFGSFIAFETRKVKMENLNDSQSIGVCIYNVLIMSSLGVLLSYVLVQQPDTLYAITSVLVIFTTTATQLIIFLPKLAAYHQVRVVGSEKTVSSASNLTRAPTSANYGVGTTHGPTTTNYNVGTTTHM